MGNFLSVVWDADPAIFTIGSFELRYYGVAWALTFAIGMLMFANFIKREGLSPKILDTAVWYGTIATILGARLGHCLFYAPGYYLSHPLEILKIWEGGLASHGAAIGLLVGLWLFSRRVKLPYIWPLDRVMFPVTAGGALVRLGNLMNSEIYGVETDLPWGFIFVSRGETVPMHPTQLYEAICYLLTFAVLLWLYYRRDMGRRRPGFLFGVGLIGVFLSRFFIEYIKNPQEAFENDMSLLMGQWLSIPFILLGVVMIVRACRHKPKMEKVKPGRDEKKSAARQNIVSGRGGSAAANVVTVKNGDVGKDVKATKKTNPQTNNKK